MIRVGQGFDVHKFSTGRLCIIGGVIIDHPLGLQGHSDADVLLHAISDAILGAAGLGDIGYHFPDNNPKFKDMSSRDILRIVVSLIGDEGYTVNNIDATVICETPKISPYSKKMIENISEDCLCELTQINIKATTTEGLGFTGRSEGIAAQAICIIKAL
jgi:2-C-methyl-D-erythritol 2,4-cyclodiphosphate synthase